MRTPTTDDVLRKEAVDLATDVASLMVRHRGAVLPEHAYLLAMECVKTAGRILDARCQALPWEAAALFEEARTSTVRAMVALDRAGAHATLPSREVAALNRRFHDLSLALGALARSGGAPYGGTWEGGSGAGT
jgi:hypothetical protein